jgi:hypothetical protein
MAPVTRLVGTEDAELKDAGKVEPIRRLVNVKAVYVFDISQTDGNPEVFAVAWNHLATHLLFCHGVRHHLRTAEKSLVV